MKFILLAIATMASSAVLPPALPLDLLSNPTLSTQSSVSTLSPSLLDAPRPNLSLPFSVLPDSRFTVKISMGAPLLPINSALMNILYFMSIIAGQHFMQQLQPRTYSAPYYRAVQITTYGRTEARFLLWAIYYAVNDMVRTVRFNNVLLELYWEDELVGEIRVAVKQTSNLAGGAGDLSLDLGDQLAQPNLTGSGEGTTQPSPIVGSVTDSNLALLTFPHLNASTKPLAVPPRFAVSFESIAGAGNVDRNDVFLTFYAALLHVAQFPAESQMQSFQSDSPSGKLHLHMQDIGIGCQVSQGKSNGVFVIFLAYDD